LSAEYYSTPRFMSTHASAIRSSYMFNPRMKTATAGSLRAYQKVTDFNNNIVRALNGDQSIGLWAAQYNALFNYLRNAP
jgi:hypothetical protein